jgi:hypothetical protein
MIEWVIGFLVAKWWVDKEEKNKVKQEPPEGNSNHGISFGYLKEDESIRDLI